MQITVSNDRYLVQLELPGFAPEDFSLKSKGDAIILEAKHNQGKAGDDEVTSRYEVVDSPNITWEALLLFWHKSASVGMPRIIMHFLIS